MAQTQHHESIVNLWDPVTINMIVPVLLHNMEMAVPPSTTGVAGLDVLTDSVKLIAHLTRDPR